MFLVTVIANGRKKVFKLEDYVNAKGTYDYAKDRKETTFTKLYDLNRKKILKIWKG